LSSLKKWVDLYGIEKLSSELGVTSFAVRHWIKRKGFPRVETILLIAKLSKGKLDANSIIDSCKKGSRKC
jgi:hypothetical protein